jgi:hypothetical protein
VPFGHSGDSHVPPLDPAAWDLLGLNEYQIPDLLRQVAKQIQRLESVMMTEH